MYVYKAIPTITNVTLPTSTLSAGTKTIAKFTVASSGGTVAWKQVLLNITKTTTPVLTEPKLWDVTSGSATEITAEEIFQHSDNGGDADCDGADTTCELLITVGAYSSDDIEEQVSGSKTYEVRVTVGGGITTNDYVNTNINQNQSHENTGAFTTIYNDKTSGDATFVWSDVSAQSHGTGTSDWFNDYLVKNLATSTQNLVK